MFSAKGHKTYKHDSWGDCCMWSAYLVWCLCFFSVHERAGVTQVVHKVKWFGDRPRNVLSQTFWKPKPNTAILPNLLLVMLYFSVASSLPLWDQLAISFKAHSISFRSSFVASGKSPTFFGVQRHHKIISCQNYVLIFLKDLRQHSLT